MPSPSRTPLQSVHAASCTSAVAVVVAVVIAAVLAAFPCQAEPVQVRRATALYPDPEGISRQMGHVHAGAVVDATGGRFGPWREIRLRSGPRGWVQAGDLDVAETVQAAPALPARLVAAMSPSQEDQTAAAQKASSSATLAAATLEREDPGLGLLAQADTFSLSTETARGFGFAGGLDLLKLPRAARRTPGNADLPPPIEPTLTLEKTMGQSFAIQQLAGRSLVSDVATQHYINLLGRWLSAESSRPGLDWTFAVVDDAAFAAFSAPGGYVFVTRGLLERVDNEAELAGVMAREIVMVAERYHLRGGAMALPGQADQLEADVLATELCARTGLEAYGLRQLMQRLADKGWLGKGPFQPMIEMEPAPQTRLDHLTQIVADRFENMEVAPARRVSDRVGELGQPVAPPPSLNDSL